MIASGPLETLRNVPVIGFLFEGTPGVVAAKVLGSLLGLWLLVAALRALLSRAERGSAGRAKALAREGRYEEAADLHMAEGNWQAAVHLYERAGAWGKGARVAKKLGQEAVAARFFERAGEFDAAAAAYRAAGDAAGAARMSGLAAAGRQPEHEQAAPPALSGARPAERTQVLPQEDPHEAVTKPVVQQPAAPQGVIPAADPGKPAAPSAKDRYVIERELGRGGMAVVYRARDRVLGRVVALKFLDEATSKAGSVPLFLREARVAAGLSHPGIVTIFDVGVIDEKLFISMELIEGENVFNLMQASGRLAVAEAVWIALRTAEALEYAHRRQVVHRDIKPSNLMVTRDGVLKVTDFGLARAFDTSYRSTQVSGTPAYMAPEQFSGIVVDGRADVFSLGATLYEMLTGELPYAGLDRSATPIPPSRRNPEVPIALDAVVLRALLPNPVDRHTTAAEFAEALQRACEA